MTTAFLVCSLLFPRPTLLVCWLWLGMPENTTPLALDVLGAIFAPRLLLAWWAYEASVHPFWIVLYVVFSLFVSRGTSRRAHDWTKESK